MFSLQVLILSEKLHLVTSKFDQLRALRFQDAINRVTRRRKPKQSGRIDAADGSTSESTKPREDNNLDARKVDDVQAEPMKFQQQLLDDETCALQVISIQQPTEIYINNANSNHPMVPFIASFFWYDFYAGGVG